MDQTEHICGNCGAALPNRLRHARMVTCERCGSTSVLKDAAFRLAGEAGVMLDAPSLIRIGSEIEVGPQRLLPVGQAQFDYGRGCWDEFWCLDESGEGCWLSADEGDYAVERPLQTEAWPRDFHPRLGAEAEINGLPFRVTEAETATCRAVMGEFPEELAVGETHLYFDLSGPDGEIATHERWDGGEGWTVGLWVDPWDVRPP